MNHMIQRSPVSLLDRAHDHKVVSGDADNDALEHGDTGGKGLRATGPQAGARLETARMPAARSSPLCNQR